VGWAHIGAFGTREAILAEKLGAVTAMAPGGVFYHESDPWLLERLPHDVQALDRKTFAIGRNADLFPETVEWGWAGTRFSTLQTGVVGYPCPGPGPLMAALASILVASTLGIERDAMRRVLEAAKPRALRMEPRPLGSAMALLDCYNASPESSLSAIDFLLRLPREGKRWLAFGEMRELGDWGERAHREVGQAAADLDGAFFLGEGCRPALDAFTQAGGRGPSGLFADHESLAQMLLSEIGESDVVLIKGARLMEMERIYGICSDAIAGRGGK
jgi:UDP-N-acetylmuramoyl-tripeptide--D-alanyl-D-alanine ligase